VNNKDKQLRDKFKGCIGGCHIGSAMGAAVEGMLYPEIEQAYGFVDSYLPYEHYNNGWKREPGTTEDGVERQKLMILAIAEKGDRVTAEDVKNSWVKNANPNAAGWISEPFEGNLLAMAKSGMPARDIGKYCDYAGLNSFARACHPIGLIHAGDIDGAMDDIYEVGQLYQTSNSRGLKWACVTGVSIAAATLPHATVDSVLGAIYDTCDKDLVVREIDTHLKGSRGISDIQDLRRYFDDYYSGKGMPYPFSYANEVVTKGICIFQMVKGCTKDAILAGVNMGRDTDCVAAVAGGISGALCGSSSIPEEWITQLDYAAGVNPYTCEQHTLEEHTDMLYQAFETRMDALKQYIHRME
jgi:hypothetical protein